jgi:hypothetical protein
VVARDTPAVDDAQSDEILRELEEHHQRGQPIARPSAPRGSAELQPAFRRRVSPARRREVRGRGSGESKLRGRRSRLVVSLAAAVFMATASALTVSQLGGKTNRAPTPGRSGGLAAITGFTVAPANPFGTKANAIAHEDRQLRRRVKAPVRHHRPVATVRKHSTRQHSVSHATVLPAASTLVATSGASYSSSSSVTSSSSQPATSTTAAAASSTTSQQTQPAFGLNGSLGPGRGGPGTQ